MMGDLEHRVRASFTALVVLGLTTGCVSVGDEAETFSRSRQTLDEEPAPISITDAMKYCEQVHDRCVDEARRFFLTCVETAEKQKQAAMDDLYERLPLPEGDFEREEALILRRYNEAREGCSIARKWLGEMCDQDLERCMRSASNPGSVDDMVCTLDRFDPTSGAKLAATSYVPCSQCGAEEATCAELQIRCACEEMIPSGGTVRHEPLTPPLAGDPPPIDVAQTDAGTFVTSTPPPPLIVTDGGQNL